jgi:hypothetical protein
MLGIIFNRYEQFISRRKPLDLYNGIYIVYDSINIYFAVYAIFMCFIVLRVACNESNKTKTNDKRVKNIPFRHLYPSSIILTCALFFWTTGVKVLVDKYTHFEIWLLVLYALFIFFLSFALYHTRKNKQVASYSKKRVFGSISSVVLTLFYMGFIWFVNDMKDTTPNRTANYLLSFLVLAIIAVVVIMTTYSKEKE